MTGREKISKGKILEVEGCLSPKSQARECHEVSKHSLFRKRQRQKEKLEPSSIYYIPLLPHPASQWGHVV